MSRELINPEGYRFDGRKAGELRQIDIELNPIPDVDGSCIFSIGNTKVLAAVTGPCDARFHSSTDCLLTIDYQISAYAFNERRLPQSSNPLPGQSNSNQCKEYSQLLSKIFEKVILLHKWPNSTIYLTITVLCDQGSALSASINAATCALMMAGVDMNDLVTATTGMFIFFISIQYYTDILIH